MSDDLASASVLISPDLSWFKEELEAGLEEATAGDDKTVRIKVDVDDAEARAQLAEDDALFGESSGSVDQLRASLNGAGLDADAFQEEMWNSAVSADDLATAAENSGVSLDDLVGELGAAHDQGVPLHAVLEGLASDFIQVGYYSGAAGDGLDDVDGKTRTYHDDSQALGLVLDDVADKLVSQGLATRNSGGDLQDLDGNLITSSSLAKSFGIVLDQGTVSATGMDEALTAFASGGAQDAASALSDAELAANAAFQGTDALAASTNAVDSAMLSAAAADNLFTLGMVAMEDGAQEGSASMQALADAAGAGGGGASGAISGLAESAGDAIGPMGVLIAVLAQAATALIPIAAVGAGAALGIAGAFGIAEAAVGAFALASASQLGGLTSTIEADAKQWAAQFSGIATPAIQSIEQIVPVALNAITPVAEAGAAGVNAAVGQIKSAVDSPEFTTFTNWIADQAPSDITSLTSALLKFGLGIGQTFENSTPLIHDMDSGFNSLASDLDRFSESNGFKEFISYVQMEMPEVSQFVETFGKTAVNALVDLAPVGEATLKTITDLMNVFNDLQPVIHVLGVAFGVLQSSLDDLDKTAGNAVATTSNLLSALSPAVGLFHLATGATDDQKSSTDKLSSSTKQATSDTKSAANAADQLSYAQENASTSSQKLASSVTSAMSQAQSAFNSSYSVVSAFSGQTAVAGSDIAKFFSDSASSATQWTANIQSAIQQGFNPGLIAQLIEAGPAQAGPVLGSMVGQYSQSFVQEVNSSYQAMESASTESVQLARLTQEAVNASSSAMVNNLQSAIAIQEQESSQGTQATVQSIADALNLGIPQVEKIAKQYAIALPSQIGENVDPTQAAAATQGAAATTGMSDSMEANKGAVAAASADLSDAGLSGLSDLGPQGEAAGENLSQGIANGIIERGATAIAAATTVGISVVGAVDEAMQNKSPSKLGILSGTNFDLGIAGGLTSGTPGVITAATDMATAVVNAATGILRAAPIAGPGPTVLGAAPAPGANPGATVLGAAPPTLVSTDPSLGTVEPGTGQLYKGTYNPYAPPPAPAPPIATTPTPSGSNGDSGYGEITNETTNNYYVDLTFNGVNATADDIANQVVDAIKTAAG